MRNVFWIALGFIGCGILGATFLVGVQIASAQTTQMGQREATNEARDCLFKVGAAEEITSTTGASDSSAALTKNSRYLVKCDSEGYVRWGTSAATAASGDFKLPQDTVLPFRTNDTVIYFAARSVSVSGSCWVLECQ